MVQHRRVVITGMGAVCPGGLDSEATWKTVAAGISVVRPIERFRPLAAAKAGATVPGFEGPVDQDRSLAAEFGATALREALGDAGLSTGATVDFVAVAHHGERTLRSHGGRNGVYGIAELVRMLADMAGAARSAAVYGACAGGGLAIGGAYEFVRSGRADVAVAGGVDCLLREFDYAQFSSLYAMSTRDCPPAEASCPFDKRRDGFVMGEGAAFLVVEAEEHALARGAVPRAVLEGYGSSQNAYDLIASPPDARGPSLAMQAALADAGVQPESVDYINAHGTSTRDNDWCETLAVRQAFGPCADVIPMSSSKSILGHAMGAAGAIEAVISVKALEEGLIPPTINLKEPDPMCDLDYVPDTARRAELRRVMSNSFGFGGHNTAVILGRAS
ncbi:beta-ketoacyl-[acyl-carrier-protein] synthase family protein [Streptomyces sp. NPDC096013]|uniref:beta-ketoacyl-[acyl-carrier-protein] synthase family protein n=1 Tax=Streptomyces sp. NPDC096013 TaxID=3366069 RepID=UPI0038217F3F